MRADTIRKTRQNTQAQRPEYDLRHSATAAHGRPYQNPTVSLDPKRICFSIPGEVTDGFLSQIAMFALALRALPAPIGQARIIAYLGCTPGVCIPPRWQPYLQDIEIRLIHRPESEKQGIIQAPLRFCQDDPTLDYVILCDADTLILGDISEVLSLLGHGFPAAGVIAHGAPFGIEEWNRLSTQLTGSSIALPYMYTLWDLKTAHKERAPFYVNHGFLAFRADALRDFSAPYLKMRKVVADSIERSFFTGQVALSLTLNALGWRGAALPMRYNFPNDPRALNLHAHESQHIRVLHYLREHHFQRAHLFADADSFHAFLDTAPEAPDQPLHDAITRLTGACYPFPAP